jgi:hypothetical protein
MPALPVRIDDTTISPPFSSSAKRLPGQSLTVVQALYLQQLKVGGGDIAQQHASAKPDGTPCPKSMLKTLTEKIRGMDIRHYFKYKKQGERNQHQFRMKQMQEHEQQHQQEGSELIRILENRKQAHHNEDVAAAATAGDQDAPKASPHHWAPVTASQLAMPIPNPGLGHRPTIGAKVVISGVMALVMTVLVMAMWCWNRVRLQRHERARGRKMKMRRGGKKAMAMVRVGSWDERAERGLAGYDVCEGYMD